MLSNVEGRPDFTVCIPTFNRGVKALNLVKVLLDEVKENWEVLVLDNASEVSKECYDEIYQISKSSKKLRYFRQDENLGFKGNFLTCFEQCNSNYFMIMSDEDFVNVDFISEMMGYMYAGSPVGIIRGSIKPHCSLKSPSEISISYPDAHLSKGKEALYHFSFFNNYPHGTIYSLEIAKSSGALDRLRENLEKQAVYPHLYVDMLIASVSDVVLSSKVASFEGESDEFLASEDSTLSSAYSFGGRLNQVVALRDAVFESVSMLDGDFNDDLFVLIYLKLCEKYYYLVSRVNMQEFVSYTKLNPVFLQKSLYDFLCAAISIDEKYKNSVMVILSKLEEINEKWEKVLLDDISNVSFSD